MHLSVPPKLALSFGVMRCIDHSCLCCVLCRLSLQELLHPRENGTMTAYAFTLLLSLSPLHNANLSPKFCWWIPEQGLYIKVLQRMEPGSWTRFSSEFRVGAFSSNISLNTQIFSKGWYGATFLKPNFFYIYVGGD